MFAKTHWSLHRLRERYFRPARTYEYPAPYALDSLPAGTFNAANTTISVIIPAKNGGAGLLELLQALRRQRGFRRLEIIIVDSGSSDGTPTEAKQWADRVHTLPAASFSHAESRNLGADLATGDYLLFTVQDALPPSAAWLQQLFCLLRANDVVAASCAETMRPDVDLHYATNGWLHQRTMGLDRHDRLLKNPPSNAYLALRKNAQLSNVGCLIDRDVFQQYRFQGSFGEDLDLGLRLIQDNYRLGLFRQPALIHSHRRPASYYLTRGFVDAQLLLRLFPGQQARLRHPERLMGEFNHARYTLNQLAEALAVSPLPLPLGQIDTLIEKIVAPALRRNHGEQPAGSQQWVDPDFARFLAHNQARLQGKPRQTNRFLWTLYYRLRQMLTYLKLAGATLDEALLLDFQESMYKGFAQHAGTHLARGCAHHFDMLAAYDLQPWFKQVI